ncbi:hypothetical protein C8A00DRAFT_38740 [Chaetomidium leptoderma]|uniref:Uncharacterized protein n=1 Tax=Chaetomidium leptoderma TaxID=669021 RepID=A0AAN6VEK0_9PEZI|nr:hypothetical protein C8A00DRAFT_38740 [Chaetomidium leptoderma]
MSGSPGPTSGASLPSQLSPNISLKAFSSDRRAIELPWGRQLLQFGAPFSSNLEFPFSPPKSAFDKTHLEQASIIFDASPNGGKYEEHTTTSTISSSDHLSVGFGLSIGGSLLGAGVSGDYNKAVLDNNDSNKTSQTASIRLGHLRFAEEPPLSDDAERLLSEQAIGGFTSVYGDYYVGGFSIGADSGICMSFAKHEHSESEAWEITVTVKFLFMSASHTWSDSTASSLRDVELTVLGYDSLAGKNINASSQGGKGLEQLRDTAVELVARNTSLAMDVESKVQQLGFRGNKNPLSRADLANAEGSQILSGILLLPYTGLRQVASHLPPKWP